MFAPSSSRKVAMQTAKLQVSDDRNDRGYADRVPGLLYTDAVSFSVGCICTLMACVVTCFQTDTVLAWTVCYALGVVTFLRVVAVSVYGRLEVVSRNSNYLRCRL